MAIVLTCHLIETIWSKKELGMRAPFMVIDHNGQQHQTDVMKAGAVTVWNTKATFPYAPSSDLVVMAFDAAGRQPGAFIAQAVVDVAAMLQEGSLNASAALVNRRGQNVGVVLFDVGLVTSSRAMAAGLDIPSLTFSTQPVPSSPTAQLTRGSSPIAGGRSSSPFAQLAVQRGVTQAGEQQQQPVTPGTSQSISQKLVGSISQALVGALLGLETRDRDDTAVQQTGSFGLRSSSVSPRRMGPVSRSLDASPTRAAAAAAAQQQRYSSGTETSQRTAAAAAAAARQAAASARAGSPSNSPLLSRRSLMQQQTQAGNDGLEQMSSPPVSVALARSSTTASGTASAPPMAAPASERASFSAWQQPLMSNTAPHNAGSSAAAAAAAAAADRLTHQQNHMAASANGVQARNNATAVSNRPHSTSSPDNAVSRRPSQLVIPSGNHSSSTAPNPGSSNSPVLSPLTEARNRLRLHRPQPLPPLSHLFPPQQREGLIPVGRAPTSPGGYSQATTTGYSQFSNGYPSPRGLEGTASGTDYPSPRGGPEALSADYDSLLREFDAADAAGKEAILFRELMVQQHERQAGSRQLLSMLSAQNQQEVLEHRQLMDALEGMASAASPVTSPARAAADAFASCFSSSTQITSGSSSGGGGNSSDASRGDTPFKHYPNLPEFAAPAAAAGPAATAAAAAAAAAAAVTTQQKHRTQGRGVVSPAAASAVSSPNRPAAGGLLQQLSSAENDASPLRSARQGHKLLGDRVGQPGSAQSSPMSAAAAAAVAANAAEDDAAAVRQWNWQLLERMTQQEAAAAAAGAAAAAATPVKSYAISNAGTELSDGSPDDAEAPQDVSEAAAAAVTAEVTAAVVASPKVSRQARVPAAYTCNKAPGKLGTVYYTTSSSSNGSSSDQAGAKKPCSASSRWTPPLAAKDTAACYSRPQPAYPFVAVPVEPSAPLMPVPEEYPCA